LFFVWPGISREPGVPARFSCVPDLDLYRLSFSFA
jgi:hypothetical protein